MSDTKPYHVWVAHGKVCVAMSAEAARELARSVDSVMAIGWESSDDLRAAATEAEAAPAEEWNQP